MRNSKQQPGQCACGASRFTAQNNPLVRMICHCEICQQFNQAPFADISIYRAADVELHDGHSIEFQTYRPPPAVQRGKCIECQTPAIEYLRLPLLPKLTIIPSENFTDASVLPEPTGHLFYHRRLSNMEDDLPKYSGYMSSQLGLSRHLFVAFLRQNSARK